MRACSKLSIYVWVGGVFGQPGPSFSRAVFCSACLRVCGRCPREPCLVLGAPMDVCMHTYFIVPYCMLVGGVRSVENPVYRVDARP
jgi:hypothetical protein